MRIQASNIYRVWIPQINRIIITRDVRVDEAIKFTHKELEDMIPLSQRTIITILEQNIDEQEIKKLIKETTHKRQNNVTNDDDDNDHISVKNAHTELPTPPPSDQALNQSETGFDSVTDESNSTTTSSTTSRSPSPQRQDSPVLTPASTRTYNRRPTE